MDVQDAEIEAPAAPRLAYVQAGRGRDVVLVHGALVDRTDMGLALLPRLGEQFRVTAFDRPGHGQSARLGATGSPWRQAAQLHAACQALGLERPVVVGHSFGGAVALAYAAQFPSQAAGVVALAPICFPEVRLEHLVFGLRGGPVLGRMLAEGLSATVDRALLPVLWRAMFLPQSMPAKFAAGFPFARAGQTSRTVSEGQDSLLLNFGLWLIALNAGRCLTPVRIFAGDRDLVVANRRHGAIMAKLLPDAHYEELPGLGHMVHHFAPERVAAAVAELAR